MSTLKRDQNIEELGNWFDRLARLLEREGFLGRLSLNTEIEYVFRDILNILYSWKLGNANDLFSKNKEAIDLSSVTDRIAIQVTTTQNATKITHTLKKFIPNLSKDYDRLIFVYPAKKKSTSKKDYSALHEGFDFCPQRDRLDFDDLLKHAQTLKIDQQNQLLELIRKELAPLGEALQMGVEPSVEVLIKVIAHMASTELADNKSVHDSVVDPGKKLIRFQEHAAYLKRQFTLNCQYYEPIQAARNAIGYDAANVPRIQGWLKQNSLSKLEDENNDAKAAFEALTTQLLQTVHSSGRDADRTAVSYLLADELFRCNVFPNPKEL